MGSAYLTDPVLLLIDPETTPASFGALADAEQMWRGRLMLAVWWWTRNFAFAWWAAMDDDPNYAPEWRKIMEETTDEALLGKIRMAIAEEAVASGDGMSGLSEMSELRNV